MHEPDARDDRDDGGPQSEDDRAVARPGPQAEGHRQEQHDHDELPQLDPDVEAEQGGRELAPPKAEVDERRREPEAVQEAQGEGQLPPTMPRGTHEVLQGGDED